MYESQPLERHLNIMVIPEFTFEGLVTNVPYGRYHFTTKEEIPGTGDVYVLEYLVKAPYGI